MNLIDTGAGLNHIIDLDRLNDKSIVVDAGACHGKFIGWIKEKVNCKVIALEPSKKNYNFIRAPHNVTVVNKALVGDNRLKEVRFYEHANALEHGNLYQLYEGATDNYDVETISINNIFKTFRIDHIDYLKMDIEGAEWDVVNTMKVSTANKIYQISMELHTHKEEIKKKLKTLGFKLKEYPHEELYCYKGRQ